MLNRGRCAKFYNQLSSLSRKPCGERIAGPFILAEGLDFGFKVEYSYETFTCILWAIALGVIIMQWTAPAFEEVCLNCEINSYASAQL
jgi:coenzyme PQQ precursor peptide PqqA